MKQDNQFILGMQRIPALVILCFVSVGLWMAFSKLAVPPIIEMAYRGESFSSLNNVIQGQAVQPVNFYLQLWDHITMAILWPVLAFWMLSLFTTSKFFFRKFVGEATPGTLGAIRLWTCAILLVTTLWDDLGSIALLPHRMDTGFMKVLDLLPIGFDKFLTSESSLRLFQRLTELLLFLGFIGWRTRILIPLCTVCAFVLSGILRQYSGYWHQNLVPIYVLAVLSFMPCADGWSIDRLRRIYQGRPVPDAERASSVYGWARYACWVPIALTYAAAGFSKIRGAGLHWLSATNMRSLLYEQTLYPRAGNFSISLHLASAPDSVFVLLALAAFLSESLFITVLFSRTCRRIFPPVMILMHIGIIFLQDIVFFDLMLLLLIFYDLTEIPKRIGRWMSNARSMQILYDGMCPFCRRTVRTLASLDIFHRLEFADFRRLDLVEFNHKHTLGLTITALENEMFLRVGNQTYSGFEAYRVIVLALPPLWPLAPWLFLPGVSTLGKWVYGYVARNRLALIKCDATCSIENAPSDNPILNFARNPRRYVLGCSFAVAAGIATLGSFWFQ